MVHILLEFVGVSSTGATRHMTLLLLGQYSQTLHELAEEAEMSDTRQLRLANIAIEQVGVIPAISWR